MILYGDILHVIGTVKLRRPPQRSELSSGLEIRWSRTSSGFRIATFQFQARYGDPQLYPKSRNFTLFDILVCWTIRVVGSTLAGDNYRCPSSDVPCYRCWYGELYQYGAGTAEQAIETCEFTYFINVWRNFNFSVVQVRALSSVVAGRISTKPGRSHEHPGTRWWERRTFAVGREFLNCEQWVNPFKSECGRIFFLEIFGYL